MVRKRLFSKICFYRYEPKGIVLSSFYKVLWPHEVSLRLIFSKGHVTYVTNMNIKRMVVGD